MIEKIFLNFQNSNQNIPPNHSYYPSQSASCAPLNRFVRSCGVDSFQLATRMPLQETRAYAVFFICRVQIAYLPSRVKNTYNKTNTLDK